MPSNIKLTYFNGRWIAEVTRFLLKYGDIEFEDHRIEQKDWAKVKPTTPTGTLPIYEENGKCVAESVAIARHVAKKVGLTGSNDWEDLQIDAVVDTINDFRLKVQAIFTEKDDAKKETLKKQHLTETAPFYLERLDKLAEKNGGYLGSEKLTWADFFFTTAMDMIELLLGESLVKKYPNLVDVRENVLDLPQIKVWTDSRPESSF